MNTNDERHDSVTVNQLIRDIMKEIVLVIQGQVGQAME